MVKEVDPPEHGYVQVETSEGVTGSLPLDCLGIDFNLKSSEKMSFPMTR